MTEEGKDGVGKEGLSHSPSNDSFVAALLLTSSFPTSALTPPSGVVSASSAV